MSVLDWTPPARWVSVFTIDPGQRTGWAWLLFERPLLRYDGSVGTVKVAQAISKPWFMSGEMNTQDELRGASDLVRYVRRSRERAVEICRKQPRTVVVCESFTSREGTMDSNVSAPDRLSNRVQQELSHEEFQYEFVEQSPSDAKGTITDKRLKLWGLWYPGEPHRNDAMRHLLLWLRKEGQHG